MTWCELLMTDVHQVAFTAWAHLLPTTAWGELLQPGKGWNLCSAALCFWQHCCQPAVPTPEHNHTGEQQRDPIKECQAQLHTSGWSVATWRTTKVWRHSELLVCSCWIEVTPACRSVITAHERLSRLDMQA